MKAVVSSSIVALLIISVALIATTPRPVQAQTGLHPSWAVISFSSAGANSIVTGCPAFTRVYKIVFTAAAATTITFKDGTTAVSGAYSFTASGAAYFPLDTVAPWITATAGHDVVLTNANAVQISGQVWYACTST